MSEVSLPVDIKMSQSARTVQPLVFLLMLFIHLGEHSWYANLVNASCVSANPATHTPRIHTPHISEDVYTDISDILIYPVIRLNSICQRTYITPPVYQRLCPLLYVGGAQLVRELRERLVHVGEPCQSPPPYIRGRISHTPCIRGRICRYIRYTDIPRTSDIPRISNIPRISQDVYHTPRISLRPLLLGEGAQLVREVRERFVRVGAPCPSQS